MHVLCFADPSLAEKEKEKEKEQCTSAIPADFLAGVADGSVAADTTPQTPQPLPVTSATPTPLTETAPTTATPTSMDTATPISTAADTAADTAAGTGTHAPSVHDMHRYSNDNHNKTCW